MALPAVIEPCLPSPGERPPTGPDWVHEIKHDGYRLMARRDALSVGIRLLTRNGYDWSSRYPLIVRAVNKLKVRSCLIDGEAVCCNERGVSSFDKLRHRITTPRSSSLPSTCWSLMARTCGESRLRCASRRWPACCVVLCRGCSSTPISRIPATSCSSTPARWGWRASSQSGWVRTTGPFFGIPLFPPEWGQFAAIQAVAPSLRMEVIPISLRDAGEIERAVTAFVLLE